MLEWQQEHFEGFSGYDNSPDEKPHNGDGSLTPRAHLLFCISKLHFDFAMWNYSLINSTKLFVFYL